jgi:hypothetical protein
MSRAVEEWIGKSDDEAIPRRVRVRIFLASDGQCKACQRQLRPGDSMGFIENRYYDRGDPCGKKECNREAQMSVQAERDEAHEQLDRDMGWD